MNVSDVDADVADDRASTTVGAAAEIVTVIDDGAPEEIFAWFAEPVYDTENDDASASELVPDEPAAIVDVAEIVHTVDDGACFFSVCDDNHNRNINTGLHADRRDNDDHVRSVGRRDCCAACQCDHDDACERRRR